MNLNRMYTARARVLAVLTVLLLALPAGALGRSQYFCRMMGRLVDTCCCKDAAGVPHALPKSSTPEIQSEDCCQLIQRGAREAAPALRDGALRVLSPLLATAPAFTSAVPEPVFAAITIQLSRARAPPPLRQPIFLRNCSFLT